MEQKAHVPFRELQPGALGACNPYGCVARAKPEGFARGTAFRLTPVSDVGCSTMKRINLHVQKRHLGVL